MKNKLEFQYGLFVGKHMDKPLKVKDGLGRINNFQYCTLEELICDRADYNIKRDLSVKPQLINPKSLTDEDWLWIAVGDDGSINYKVDKFNDIVVVHGYNSDGIIDKSLMVYEPPTIRLTQEQYNRMYSKQSIPNFTELLEAELIEEVEREF